MSKYCTNCGEPITGKFCSNCGKLIISEDSNYSEIYNDDISDNKINPNIFKNASNVTKIKKKPGCLSYVVIIIIILLIIRVILPSKENLSSDDITAKTTNSKTTATTEVVVQTKFQKVTGTTEKQQTKILSILSSCGIDIVNDIEADEMLNDINEEGETGYRISYNGINNIILYLKKDKTVNMVRYADHDLYATGKVISTLDDYTFTFDEKTRLQVSCKDAVTSILKSPSTSKFPNITKWAFGKEDGKIVIQSYVDSQNSFGAELRSDFQFILSSKDYTIKSFIFDGEELIKK